MLWKKQPPFIYFFYVALIKLFNCIMRVCRCGCFPTLHAAAPTPALDDEGQYSGWAADLRLSVFLCISRVAGVVQISPFVSSCLVLFLGFNVPVRAGEKHEETLKKPWIQKDCCRCGRSQETATTSCFWSCRTCPRPSETPTMDI